MLLWVLTFLLLGAVLLLLPFLAAGWGRALSGLPLVTLIGIVALGPNHRRVIYYDIMLTLYPEFLSNSASTRYSDERDELTVEWKRRFDQEEATDYIVCSDNPITIIKLKTGKPDFSGSFALKLYENFRFSSATDRVYPLVRNRFLIVEKDSGLER